MEDVGLYGDSFACLPLGFGTWPIGASLHQDKNFSVSHYIFNSLRLSCPPPAAVAQR